MSSSDSAVRYTSISFEDVPFWGIRFFGIEQADSPEAAPQSPIQTLLVPQDEREPMFIQPRDPDHVPEPMYPEYIPLEDEHVLPAEEQPLSPVVLPTAESPGYVAESNPEDDPEEYEDDESEDGPVDYPMDRGYDGDGDDDDSSGDDTDDEDEEEHLASTDSNVVVPTVEPVSLPKGIEPVIPPPSTDTTTTGARITALIDAVTAALPSPPLPPLPPPLYIPPPVDHRDDIPETELPPRKKSCLFALGPRYKVGDSSTARPIGGRGIDYVYEVGDSSTARPTEDPAEAVPKIAPMTLGEAEMVELRETDRRRQAQMVEILRVMGDIRREMGDMQA
nr:hypothetical protein [Tanacetum cinerariifolium]